MWFHDACEHEFKGPFTIVALCTADLGKAKLSLSKEETFSRFFTQLDRVFNNSKAKAKELFVDGVIATFDTDPYIRGAYRFALNYSLFHALLCS